MSRTESPTGGVKPFSIASRTTRVRERLLGMTDDERRWRAQWLKDQHLSAEEPRFVSEYYKTTNNIFRRIWQFPARQFENLLTPFLGKSKAELVRMGTATGMKMIASIYIFAYILKYHSDDFLRYRTLEVLYPRPVMYPDEPGFPNFPRKTVEDYCDLGFYSSVLCVDSSPPPPPPPPPPPELPEACNAAEGT